MNLTLLERNVDFRQSSSSIFGYPEAKRKLGNLGTAMLFEWYLLEQIPRVQQPPKIRETFAVAYIKTLDGQNRP